MGALQSIFFRPARGYKRYDEFTGIVVPLLYQLDGVISEQHTSTAKVTKHPVEYGVDLADHVIKQPQKVVVNGIVTNSPFLKQVLNRLPGDPSIISQAFGILKGSRARDAYKGLIELQNERRPVVLQTGLLSYENMVLTGVSAPSDVQDNLRVRLTFEEIFVTNGETTGALQAVTTTPTQADFVTAGIALVGLGIGVASLNGFTGI